MKGLADLDTGEKHDPRTCNYCRGVVSMREERERRIAKWKRRLHTSRVLTLVFGSIGALLNGGVAIFAVDHWRFLIHAGLALICVICAAIVASKLLDEALKDRAP